MATRLSLKKSDGAAVVIASPGATVAGKTLNRVDGLPAASAIDAAVARSRKRRPSMTVLNTKILRYSLDQ
jgi:hypothetical protein